MSVMAKYTRFYLAQRSVNVKEDVLQVWHRHRQTETGDNESFGVLIGSRSEDNKTFWVESCTTPQLQDGSTMHSFTMRDRSHQKIVESSFHESKGLLGYIGTWHTHPEDIPNPSVIDLTDWTICAERNLDRFLFFFIVGIEETRGYMKVGDTFLSLKLEDYSG